MSSSKTTEVIQTQIQVPSLSDINPINSNDPLIKTIAQGDIPSNALLNNALEKAKENIEVSRQEATLNSRGDTLAKDAENILESAQRFINEKNAGDRFQELIKHSKEASDITSQEASKTSSSISSMIGSSLGLESIIGKKDVQSIRSDAELAYVYAKEIFYTTIQSKEFRAFLMDFINFLQSTINSANDEIQQIGNSLKQDVKQNDSNLSNTTEQIKKTQDETKLNVDIKLSEWNDQMKREYYNRFQSLLVRISEKPEYKRILSIFWKWMDDLEIRSIQIANQLSESMKEKATEMKDTISNSANKVASANAWDKLWLDIRSIIDAFAGEGSFDSFYKQTWELYYSISNDKEANLYFKNLKSFINDSVNNPSSMNTDIKIKQGEDLLVQGRNFLSSERFARKFNGVFSVGSNILNKIANDAVTNDLADKLKTFAQDFALDSQGRPDLNVIQDSLYQIKNLVYPLMTKQLSNLTIARIQGTNEQYDWFVENLLVAIPNLIPEHFELRTKNNFSINLKELETEKNNTKVTMEIKNMRPFFKDLRFWYQRKSFPRIEDFGTVDVDLSKGQGVRIKIIWKIKSKQNRPFAFSLMEVRCVIDSLDVTVKDAKHNILDRIATSLFSANLKQSLAAGIVNNIVDALQPFNDQMNEWFATRPTTSLYEKANESIHYYYDQTNQAIKNHPIDQLVNKANEAVAYVKENVQSTLESAKETISEKTAEAKQYIGEKSVELKEKVETVVEDVPVEHFWEAKVGSKQKRKHNKKSKKGISTLELENQMEFPPLANAI